MRKGDILLVHAKLDPVAWFIRKITKSHWNHVAWAIDSHFLIEARGRAIDICSIKKYLISWKYDVKLIRLQKVTKEQLKEAIAYVSQFKRKRSYFLFLKTIIRMIFMRDEARRGVITCSGLISLGLAMEEYYFISPQKKKPYLITPKDIANSRSKSVSYELKILSL